jgi:hypothetical protein
MTVRADLEALCAHPIAATGGLGRTPDRWLTHVRLGARAGRSASPVWPKPTPMPSPSCPKRGRDPVEGAIYGVWASVDPTLRAAPGRFGHASAARKSLCSGLGDRRPCAWSPWSGNGASNSLVDVEASGPTVDIGRYRVGDPGAVRHGDRYGWLHPASLSRSWSGLTPGISSGPGFWNGAIGPAACWAGAAAGNRANTPMAKACTRPAPAGGPRRVDGPRRRCAERCWATPAETSTIARPTMSLRRGAGRTWCVTWSSGRPLARWTPSIGRSGRVPFVADGRLAQRVATSCSTCASSTATGTWPNSERWSK